MAEGEPERRAAERAARESYGRLLALLARRSRDLAAAEDALGDAFLAALEAWPRDGVPANPEAWLLATSRRRLIDAARRGETRRRVLELLERTAPMFDTPGDRAEIPDERLQMLFACAHPALDPSIRMPLMLQAVLGLDAARIAAAFAVAPATMGQRLVRAKAKIRDAGIRFEVPEPEQLPERLDSVLGAIYAAYGTGWDEVAGGEVGRGDLAEEAI